MRLGLLLAALLVLLPLACAAPAAPEGVRIMAGNQRLDIEWQPVADAAGYYVHVHQGGQLKQNLTTTATRATYLGAANGAEYTVTVHAFDASGAVGPASAPATGTPRHPQDPWYLGASLALVVVALLGYAWKLSRDDRRRNRGGNT